MREVHANDAKTDSAEGVDRLHRVCLGAWGRKADVSDLSVKMEARCVDIPMVPMMEVRRKFFAGTISVFSLESHSSFIRLLK